MIESKKQKENPFYYNYCFHKEDIDRCLIPGWYKLWLWVFPTYVQIVDGYAFFFKRTPDGKIWLMKYEEIIPSFEKQND